MTFFLMILLVLFFSGFWASESLLGAIFFLILFILCVSAVILLMSSGQWESIMILIALVSGFVVVLSYVILMFPSPKSEYFRVPSIFFFILMTMGLNFGKGYFGISESEGFLNMKSDYMMNFSVYPFSLVLVAAVFILFSMLFLMEVLIKPRSVSVK
uniref:NADH dehydrogenase subunit 6 n=1 Tax=Columbicola passerinae TaxID=128994 RepID=A0A6G8QS02_9NEOP|nr:NADH dehydrogenase subunit 6 [Columbicola passerinae]